MYRSIEHQLRATARGGEGGASEGSDDGGGGGGGGGGSEAGVPSYQELRELASDHIRAHREEFAPYLVPEEEGEDPGEYFDRYCAAIEDTAVWGGHVELTALAAALKRRVTVYGVGMAPQVLGEEHEPEGAGLALCFLVHALGLGAHYNSTRKLRFPAGTGGDDGAEAGEAAAGGGGDVEAEA
jgi:OTU domain-containing protein 6